MMTPSDPHPLLRRHLGRRSFLRTGLLGLATLGATPTDALPEVRKRSSRWFKVARIDRQTVKLPYREVPGRNMARELPHWRWMEIVTVTLRSGQVGFGETCLYYTWGATEDVDVKRTLGQNAVNMMWDDTLGAGLQMALFDAVARACEVPIRCLLGTQVHKKTPLAWWNIDTSAEDMVLECKEAQKQGYLAYKTKGRPWFDVYKQVKAVSRAMPKDFHLTLDFNDTLLDARRGIPILKDLARYPQITIYETPIFQTDIPGNQAIRKATRVPVAMHYGKPPAWTALKEDICDGFVATGGASKLKRIGAVAELASKPFWLQLVGSSITAAWSLHFGGVLSQARWPAVNCHQLFTHSLLTEPIRVVHGLAAVPDKPGLGYELNPDALAKFKVKKPARRPDPPRLMEVSWPDGRKMYVANTGKVNFMLKLGQDGKFPYFERGVTTRLVANDGSEQWRKLYNRARKEAFLIK